MIKSILSILDITKINSNKYFFSFENNLDQFFVYRDNSYKLFDVTNWRHVESPMLISNYFLEETAFNDQVSKINYQGDLLNDLIDTTFNKALGQYLELKYLNNTSHIEHVSQNDIYFYSSLEYFSQTVFITKYGISLFSENNKGLIYFNEYNVSSFGRSDIFIPRVATTKVTPNYEEEEVLVLFSPYSIKECFSTGKSHFKDNLLFLTNVKALSPADLKQFFYPNFSVHLRPTKQELVCFLYFITNYLVHISKQCSVHITNEKCSFTTFGSNYAALRNQWITKLNSEKDLFVDAADSNTTFRLKCLEKRKTYDVVQFTFEPTPTNLFIFSKSFILNFFNDENINLKSFVYFYYDKDVPNAIDLNILPTAEDYSKSKYSDEDIEEYTSASNED